MADEIKRIEYYSTVIANKPGEGARILAALRDAGVNFIDVNGYPVGNPLKARKTTVDFVPSEPKLFKQAAKKLGLEIGAKLPCILVNGEDRPGMAAEILGKLGVAGINVIAMHMACAGAGRVGAMLFVEAPMAAKAARVLSK
jgi:hypothetical protein